VQIYTKKYQFWRGGCRPTFIKTQRWNLAWGYGRGAPSRAPNFVKIAYGDLSLRGNFYQKFEIFAIFSYLGPHFHTHNVKILLKRTDRLRNPSTKQNFVKIAQGACRCRYCIASEVMHMDF